MNTLSAIAALLFLLGAACSSAQQAAPKNEPEAARSTAQDSGQRMRDDAASLAAKPEHKATFVEVQHLLVSFAGTGTEAKRTKAEAENLAGDLYAKIADGADIDALIKQHTDDSYPGVYGMVADKAEQDLENNRFWRQGMVAAFGDTGWRLKVGEVGVALFNDKASPYGWHIIKRIK